MNITIIPDKLKPIASILTQYLTPLLLWLSDLTYQNLLAKDRDHLLCQLQTLLDITPLEEACTNYHRHNGQGRPVSHTVPHLLRAMLVKYLYGCSLRDLEEKIRYNILIKWFVGYPIFALPPDHTTLHRFEVYLYVHHPRLFFDTILHQVDSAFPHDRQQTLLADTFALHANAALESLIKRLRHLAQELLLAYRDDDPDGYSHLWQQLDETALFGGDSEKTECYLSTHQWRQRLFETVTAVLNCQHHLRQQPVSPSVQSWLARLDKLLTDELRLERDDNGLLISLALLSKRGSYRICSATDPEATIRNHGRSKQDFGYNVSVLSTIYFIREIQVDTGSRPDGDALPDLLARYLDHQQDVPNKLVYDQAAGTGKYAHKVSIVSNGQTQLVAKPLPPKRKPGRFNHTDFSLSSDGFSLTCPHGRSSRRRYRAGHGDGVNFRFITAQCLGCPLLKPCRGSSQIPTTHKLIFISDYREDWLALKTYSETDEFKKDMKLRPQVERIIAGLVLHNDARRARFRGLKKVGFQAHMCATAYNLKRWVSLLRQKRLGKPPKKRRRFSAPPPIQRGNADTKGGVGLMTT